MAIAIVNMPPADVLDRTVAVISDKKRDFFVALQLTFQMISTFSKRLGELKPIKNAVAVVGTGLGCFELNFLLDDFKTAKDVVKSFFSRLTTHVPPGGSLRADLINVFFGLYNLSSQVCEVAGWLFSNQIIVVAAAVANGFGIYALTGMVFRFSKYAYDLWKNPHTLDQDAEANLYLKRNKGALQPNEQYTQRLNQLTRELRIPKLINDIALCMIGMVALMKIWMGLNFTMISLALSTIVFCSSVAFTYHKLYAFYQ